MKDKVVIVTGAGRGIGREIAIRFADEGAVVACCTRSDRSVAALREEVESRGGRGLFEACDVGDPAAVQGFVQRAAKLKGTIDVLVNNAGIAVSKPFEKTTVEEWNETVRVNLTGPFLMTKFALPYMRAGSHIFNIGSNASKFGFPNWTAYCASKWGLLGFTNSLREELRSRGIKVTSVLPGPTATDIWEGIGDGNWNKSWMMKPSTVAEVVLFVARQPAEAMTEELMVMPQRGGLGSAE